MVDATFVPLESQYITHFTIRAHSEDNRTNLNFVVMLSKFGALQHLTLQYDLHGASATPDLQPVASALARYPALKHVNVVFIPQNDITLDMQHEIISITTVTFREQWQSGEVHVNFQPSG
jgi:hypothetical protein